MWQGPDLSLELLSFQDFLGALRHLLSEPKFYVYKLLASDVA